MHDYKTYKLKHLSGKVDLYSACCKCGSIEVNNPDRAHLVCSKRMHKNSTVLACNMQMVESN